MNSQDLPFEDFQSKAPRNRLAVNFSWLLKLRWVAVIGQFLTILFVFFVLQIDVPWAPLVSVLLLTVASNAALQLWFSTTFLQFHSQSKSHETDLQIANGEKMADLVLGLVMTLDMLSLTALLFATGGPMNPFNFFFFVNLSLAGVVLSKTWSWSLNILTVFCFGLLLFVNHPLKGLAPPASLIPIRLSGTPSILQSGMMVAFATCSTVIVYFLTRLTAELQTQEQTLRQNESKQAKNEKLQALGTLAAGAAHELATPLSTIAVVAKEVENQIEAGKLNDEVVDDIHLIRSELDRCRHILDQMSAKAGQAIGETLQPIGVQELIVQILDGLPEKPKIQLAIPESVAKRQLNIPVNGLEQAIRAIIKNAQDASKKEKPVSVRVFEDDNRLVWLVQDSGTGMTEDVLRRVNEPFFTTKPPGKGMGLGVFLAQSVMDRVGGSLEFDSEPGRGTRVRIELQI